MKKILASMALALFASAPAFADDFFSTDDPDQLFNVGVRVGLNTSNRTVSGSMAGVWNQNSWGTGFDAGFVADINIKNYISIQPGFFYESRSGAFAYESPSYGGSNLVQFGKGREYLFSVPIVGSLHFNVLDDLRWNVDFGPYFQFKLKSTFDHKFEYPYAYDGGIVYLDNVKTSRVDVGLKMGMGLELFKHYSVNVHYLAGLCNPWYPGELGGHNKAWLFTLGYTFY